MRAFAVTDFDQPGSVMTLPDPVPAEGELLIRVRAASVNPFDATVATGGTRAWAETRVPLVPGVDAAGVVVALGVGATGFEPGDEVVVNAGGKSYWGGGTFAELVTVPVGAVAPKPTGISFEIASALPQAGLTALGAVDILEPAAGQVIIIAGATGGVGSWFTQLAVLRGATVVALARPENADYARELGASEVIDHTQPGMIEGLRALYPGGVDALADFSGSPELVAALAALVRDGGRVASSIGKAVEAVPAERGITALQANKVDAARLPELLEPLAAGKISPPKMTVVALEDAGAVLARAGQKQGVGKTVIRID